MTGRYEESHAGLSKRMGVHLWYAYNSSTCNKSCYPAFARKPCQMIRSCAPSARAF